MPRPNTAIIDPAMATMVAENRRPATVLVLAPTRTSDGMGGSTPTWTQVASFLGRVFASNQQPANTTVGGRPDVQQLWTIEGPPGLSISKTARLRVGSTDYAVIADDEPRSFSTATHILCYEV